MEASTNVSSFCEEYGMKTLTIFDTHKSKEKLVKFPLNYSIGNNSDNEQKQMRVFIY